MDKVKKVKTKIRQKIRKYVKKTLQKVPKISVTIEKKTLGKAPEKYSFNLQDGRKLQSIYELIDELETMSEEAFRNFVNGSENHFANWVEHVFSEKTLAEEMRHVHDRIDTQRALLKHLVRELTKHHATRRKA